MGNRETIANVLGRHAVYPYRQMPSGSIFKRTKVRLKVKQNQLMIWK